MDLNDLPDEAREIIDQYREAFEQEFRVGLEEGAKKPPLADIEELKGDMLKALQHILKHGDSDALKAKVAMWGYGVLLDIGKGTKDPLADLLSGVPNPHETEAK